MRTHREQVKLLRNGVKTVGYVIKSEFVRGTSGVVFEHPIIQFTTIQGADVQVRGAQIPFLSKGEKVTLFYKSENPRHFIQETDELATSTYIIPIIAWLLVGGVIILRAATL